MIEYTEENPLGTASAEWTELAELLFRRCETATAGLGEFGMTLGGHSDGTIVITFGPNMGVDWDAVRVGD